MACRKKEEIKNIIAGCLGLYLEASSDESMIVAGDSLEIEIEVVNRSAISIDLVDVSVSIQSEAATMLAEPQQTIGNNENYELKYDLYILNYSFIRNELDCIFSNLLCLAGWE